MADKLVLCCRLPGAGMPARGRGYLERARAIIVRAEARGASLVAWGNARLYFAFDPVSIDDVVALVTKPGEEGRPGEERFAFGVAQGSLELLESDGSRADLSWGHALVAAGALAMAARPGQVLFADRVKAVRSGDLVLRGGRYAEEAGLRIRGLLLDERQPWKRDAITSLSRLVEPALEGAEGDSNLVVKPGGYAILHAARGLGGSRRLRELGSLYGGRALVVRPSGGGNEPLGALRRAVALEVARDLPPALAAHASALESLLSAEPLSLEVAQDLVVALLAPRAGGEAPGVVLVDDAELVDRETLEVLGGAVRAGPLPAVLRMQPGADAPSAFAKGPPSATTTLAKLAPEASLALARGFTAGMLDDEGARLWSRLGDGTPLGVLEALSHGLHSTELAWIGEHAFPRRKVSGRGKPRPAGHFVTLRAHQVSPAARALLATVALLGGEAKVETLSRVLSAAEQPGAVEPLAQELGRSRWLVVPEPGWVALPSRTHVESLVSILEPPVLAQLRRALGAVLESEPGFTKLEALPHALAEGDLERARRVVVSVGLALRQAKLTACEARLRSLVGLPDADPKESTDEHTQPGARGSTASKPPPAPAVAARPDARPEPDPVEPAPESEPTFVLKARVGSGELPASEGKAPTQQNPPSFAKSDAPPDSEPPTIAENVPQIGNLAHLQKKAVGAASEVPARAAPAPAPVPAPVSLADRMKAAILSSNHDELERLLSAGHDGGHDVFAERVRALSRLKRGEIGDALRVLRRVRHPPDASPSARCQSALALGIAYAAAARYEESLLEGLTALARAREGADPRGVHASLAFLARLYHAMARPEEASRLREAATDITIAQ
ncbi:MAG: hypothetical protein U0183_29490 [Polyangiaceae bacterium]